MLLSFQNRGFIDTSSNKWPDLIRTTFKLCKENPDCSFTSKRLAESDAWWCHLLLTKISKAQGIQQFVVIVDRGWRCDNSFWMRTTRTKSFEKEVDWIHWNKFTSVKTSTSTMIRNCMIINTGWRDVHQPNAQMQCPLLVAFKVTNLASIRESLFPMHGINGKKLLWQHRR